MSYNKETDYQAKINEAAAKGDYVSAAKYEQSRNAKIDGENLGYQKTSKYAGWLDKTDYGTEIKEKMLSGASKQSVADSLYKRIHKASNTEGLQKYAYDDIYERAVSYIMSDGVSFKPKETYVNTYSDKLDSALARFLNRQEFSYDVMQDNIYKYYLEMYRREGERAMEDTLGKMAENTGGVASSYAATAANQAYNYYTKKSADIIPELYNDAYERYIDSFNTDLKTLTTLSDLSENEYDRYYKEREFEYKQYIDEKDNELKKADSERDYELAIKKLEEEIFRDERDYQAELQEKRRKEALDKWKMLGYLDEESAKILNLPPGLKTSDYEYRKAQIYNIYN